MQNTHKFLIICMMLSLYEIFNHLSFHLETINAYQSIQYNLLINLIGMCLAVLSVMFLELYFEARKECVRLGLYSITHHRVKVELKEIQKMRAWLRNLWNKFKTNQRAITSGEIIGLAVSFFLVAILGPIAIGTIANTTVTNWDSAVVTVFQVVCPIIWTVGVAIRYLPGRE